MRNSRGVTPLLCLGSSKDRILPSDGSDRGSIPFPNTKKSNKVTFIFLYYYKYKYIHHL